MEINFQWRQFPPWPSKFRKTTQGGLINNYKLICRLFRRGFFLETNCVCCSWIDEQCVSVVKWKICDLDGSVYTPHRIFRALPAHHTYEHVSMAHRGRNRIKANRKKTRWQSQSCTAVVVVVVDRSARGPLSIVLHCVAGHCYTTAWHRNAQHHRPARGVQLYVPGFRALPAPSQCCFVCAAAGLKKRQCLLPSAGCNRIQNCWPCCQRWQWRPVRTLVASPLSRASHPPPDTTGWPPWSCGSGPELMAPLWCLTGVAGSEFKIRRSQVPYGSTLFQLEN